jgi:hypothetical protein
LRDILVGSIELGNLIYLVLYKKRCSVGALYV